MKVVLRPRVLLILILILTTMVGYETYLLKATPGNRNVSCTAGACSTEPCDIRVYIDTSQYGAANCRNGDNYGFNTTPDLGALWDNTVLPNCPTTTTCNVFIEDGTYTVCSQMTWQSGVELTGANRLGTMLQSCSNFAGSGTRALIWLGTVGGTSTITGVKISNLSFNVTTTSDTNVQPIHNQQPVQHATFEKLNFDLGLHGGFTLEDLGAGPGSTPGISFDLTMKDWYVRNGSGSLTLLLNGNSVSSTYFQVTIEDINNVVDISGLGDDRVAVLCNKPTGGLAFPGVHDISIINIKTNETATVTSNVINGVKFDTGTNCYMHEILVDGTWLTTNSVTPGNAIVSKIGTGSFFQNIIVRNTFSRYAAGISIQWLQKEANPFILIDGFNIYSSSSTAAAIQLLTTTTPSTNEYFVIRNGNLFNTGTLGAICPVGIMLSPGGANQGASGGTYIDNVAINSFKTGISDNVGTGCTVISSSAWTNVYVTHCSLQNGGQVTSMVGAFFFADNFGLDPVGAIGNFFTTSGTLRIGPGGSTTTPTASTDYQVNGGNIYFFCTGGTGVSITIKDAGGNAVGGLVGACSAIPFGYYLPYQWKINFGAFSAAPSITVEQL
jgi:hypothetical protein